MRMQTHAKRNSAKSLRHNWIAVFALLISFAMTGKMYAQQRMGIASGIIDLAANVIRSVPTYCLDRTRDSPSPATSYSTVLTEPQQARVTIDGARSMTLSEAIGQGLVEIRGQNLTMDQFVHFLNDPILQSRLHMSPEDRDQAKLLLMVWSTAGEAEKKELERKFQPLLADLGGDHEHLQFVNKSGKHLTINFDRPAILGPHQESISDVDQQAFASTVRPTQRS